MIASSATIASWRTTARRRPARATILSVAALMLAFMIAASFGVSDMPPRRALTALVSRQDPVAFSIMWSIRMPRLVVAALVGANLAIAGAILQSVLRNPLADPAVIGVSGGAALTTVIVLVVGDQIWKSATGNPYASAPIPFSVLPLVALVGALTAALLVAWLARDGSAEKFVLCGLAVAASAQAITVGVLAGWGTGWVEGIVAWIAGSLYARGWDHAVALAPWTAAGIACLAVVARPAAVMALGDDSATTLGLRAAAARRVLIVVAAMLAASAVAITGPVGFVGLVTPHVARAVVGHDPRRVIPLAAIHGAILVLVADCAGRVVMQPYELPVGVVTALVGAPVFAWLQRRTARGMFQ